MTAPGARAITRALALVLLPALFGASAAAPVGQTALPAAPSASAQAPAAVPASLSSDPRVRAALETARTWLEAQRAYDRIPGLSAAIVRDQEVLWSGGFGYADLERKAPATDETIFSICSISKLFTSIAVMQLRDAGKLRLDDPVEKLLPWFAIRNTAPQGGKITVEGLLTHASGLPRESDYPYWNGPDFPFPTREQVKDRLASQETLYPAETHFQYSNLGMTLAGEIVAAVSGVPFDEYVRCRVLEPLGMTGTTPEIPADQRGKRLATGYRTLTRDGRTEPMAFFQARGIAPAAGFASTAKDLAKFASWQFRLLGRGGNEVLDANTLREMQRIHWVEPDFETTWGLGFYAWRHDGRLFVGHDGSCPGFRSSVMVRPDDKMAVVVLTNAHEGRTTALAQALYDLVAPAVREAVKDPKGAKPLDPALDKYLGTYSAWSGEMAIVRWGDGLAAMDLPGLNPVKSLTKLKRTAGDAFRRVRDDEDPGEEVVFEIGPDGRAVRLKWHSVYQDRLR